MRRLTVLGLALTMVWLPMSGGGPTAAAGPWFVATSGDDANDCLSPAAPCLTINAAIEKAGAGDTVLVGSGIYTGIGADVVLIDRDITLSGGWNADFTLQVSTSTIDGEQLRIGVWQGVSTSATIDSFTLQNATGAYFAISGHGDLLIVRNSVIENNAGGGVEGAYTLLVENTIVRDNGDSGIRGHSRTTVISSTISGNSTCDGDLCTTAPGGIDARGDLDITNSTVSGNATSGVGGIDIGGQGLLNNVTVTNNQGGQFAGNGVRGGPGTVTVSNSILESCSGITSGGHNILGNACLTGSPGGDQFFVDPLLGPLQDNGGPTPTHALGASSPAVDAGDPATCEATDQRGIARPQGLVCDIGAFELTNPPPPPLPDGGRFFDDDGNVHEASIEAIAAEGITRGCNPPYQTGYCPDRPVTREQMAAFLVRALSLPPSSENRFTDDAGSIFEADIAALAAAGVTRGCNPPANTLFCPGRAVTRGQMAAFLVRALNYPANPVDRFNDDNDSVFEADINALGKAGVTLGCNPPLNDNFCPDQAVSRAQMASFLTRALSLPVRNVPERQASLNGVDLEVFAVANGAGCTLRNGEICKISQMVNGEFHIFTGWFADNWSAMTASERASFESSKLRLVARFDGVPIDLVAWEIEVIADTAYKTYSFQFPSWLVGSHILEIDYIDDTENYLWTLHDNLTTNGGGYPQSVEPTAPAAADPIDRTGGHLPAP